MHAILLIDLGFGDAGKGGLVDYLARRHDAHTVIRFNGGAQAAHNVVLPDGRHHTFSQFGSATLVPGVRTHLSRFMLVDPVALVQEEQHLRAVGVTDAFARLSIDRRALVVTPFQRAANRLRELARGNGRHGSCGMGIGETMADQLADDATALRVGDLEHWHTTRNKLARLQELKRAQMSTLVFPASPFVDRELALLDDMEAPAEFADLFRDTARRAAVVPDASGSFHQAGTLIFEGAQGVLLDEWHGFHPYTTWSTTTFANALTLLHENNYPGAVTRLGASRAYMTRHGAGPFVTEDAGLARLIPEAHNGTNAWQSAFRVGWLDLVMLRYALDAASGVEQLALTCLDHLDVLPQWKICRRYASVPAAVGTDDRLRVSHAQDLHYQSELTAALENAQPVYETVDAHDVAEIIAEELHAPITITSHGPAHADKLYESSGGKMRRALTVQMLPDAGHFRSAAARV